MPRKPGDARRVSPPIVDKFFYESLSLRLFLFGRESMGVVAKEISELTASHSHWQGGTDYESNANVIVEESGSLAVISREICIPGPNPFLRFQSLTHSFSIGEASTSTGTGTQASTRKWRKGVRDPVAKMSTVSEVVEDPLPDPSYTSVWPLEKTYNLTAWRAWFGSNWVLSMYISVLYICAIFFGQIIMRGRRPFVIREVLCSWNFFLAIFSVFGTLRTAPELFHILKQDNGFHLSVCRR
jgi:hypothetical protein